MNARGTLTLPREMRLKLGLGTGGQVVVEDTKDGLLLRPGVTLPVEIYTDQRLAEFAQNNDESLAGFDLGQ